MSMSMETNYFAKDSPPEEPRVGVCGCTLHNGSNYNQIKRFLKTGKGMEVYG